MSVIKNCLNCKNDFSVRTYRKDTAKFCSKSCGDTFKRVVKNCLECSKEYTIKRKQKDTNKYCSKLCQSKWRSNNLVGDKAANYKTGRNIEKDEVACKICDKLFFQLRDHLLKGFGDICSTECRSIAKSRAAKGKTRVEKVLVKCEWCSSRKLLIPSFAAQFRFCSMSCRNDWQSQKMTGENSPMWNGGTTGLREKLSSTREYKEFRNEVFKRDKFTCQRCGDNRGGNLHAHHVKPVATHPELVYSVENGLTLCRTCHEKTHQEMGSLKGKSRLKEFLASQK